MSQLKVNTIRHTGASSDAVTLASDGTCTVKATNNLSNRNLWINGACLIAQRSTTASSTNGIQTVDRYYYESGGTNEAPTFGPADVTSGGAYDAGFRKCVKITNGAQSSADAGDTVEFMYNFEAQDLANSGWNYKSTSSYITLSFWVKSSVAQNFYGYFRSRDGSAQMYSFDTGSLSANTWTKVTKIIPGNSNLTFDNDNANGLTISFDAYRGTSAGGNGATLHTWFAENNATRTPAQTSDWYLQDEATLEFTGFQMEVSDHATDFEHRSYGDELLRCMRYYYQEDYTQNYESVRYSFVSSSSQQAAQFVYPVPMRSAPTITNNGAGNFRVNTYGIGGSNDQTCTAISTKFNSNNMAILEFSKSTANMEGSRAGVISTEAQNDAALYFSAEL